MAKSTHKIGHSTDGGPDSASILDRVHLQKYTMASAELEREIIGLFRGQLPATLAQLRAVQSPADWKLVTHTLKGSAVAVGAAAIASLAAALEQPACFADGRQRQALLDQLVAAVAEFEALAQRLYA